MRENNKILRQFTGTSYYSREPIFIRQIEYYLKNILALKRKIEYHSNISSSN